MLEQHAGLVSLEFSYYQILIYLATLHLIPTMVASQNTFRFGLQLQFLYKNYH
jgi:hypothetical protein